MGGMVLSLSSYDIFSSRWASFKLKSIFYLARFQISFPSSEPSIMMHVLNERTSLVVWIAFRGHFLMSDF